MHACVCVWMHMCMEVPISPQSLVNQAELVRIQMSAAQTQAALDSGEYANSTDLWSKTQDVVESVSYHCSITITAISMKMFS